MQRLLRNLKDKIKLENHEYIVFSVTIVKNNMSVKPTARKEEHKLLFENK